MVSDEILNAAVGRMRHLGDITKIDGRTAPWVDCIIGGSPCQDLSIAGKRAGLAGARSGLFMEQIRLVKEMREASGAAYPRFMVWENVPGAFSSNKGQDFAAVLEETIRIVEPEAPDIEVPGKGWPTWGGYRDVDGRWSVAWRTLDAQYWGVPQRRRRIALVADFRGCTAAEILFERKSLFGDFAESGTERERPAGEAENGAAYAVRIRGGCDGGGKGALVQTEKSGTLGTGNDQTVFCLQGNGIDRADTAGCNGKGWREDQSYTKTLDTASPDPSKNQGGIAVVQNAPVCIGNGQGNIANHLTPDICQTLNCMHDPMAIITPTILDGKEQTSTLCARDYKGVGRCDTFGRVISTPTVRRLTPLECERLQGYPDGWTDIGEWVKTDKRGRKIKVKGSADSPRYKALGNSIALPPWRFVLYRLCMQLGHVGTMASLFDGIGGFPLIWEQINGKGSCLWASEIDEFPIAVTKRRFGI